MEYLDFRVFTESTFFQLVVIPFLIFAARVADVSLGTLRTVFISQGTRGWSALLGFIEILIWLTAITYILQNLTNVLNYVAYAGGFGAGIFVGLWLEERLAKGLVAVTTITNNDSRVLVEVLKDRSFGLTTVSAQGTTGRVRLLLSIIRRKQLRELRGIIEQYHPNAFIAVQPVRSVSKLLGQSNPFAHRFLDIPFLRKAK